MPKDFLSVPVILSEKHFKDFLIFDTMKKQRRWKKPVSLAVSLYVFASLCFAFQESYDYLGILGSILVVLTVFIPTNYFNSFHSSVKKQTLKMKLNPPRLVYTIRLSAGSGGISYNYPDQTAPAGHFSWKSIDGAWRTKDAIYLYVTPEQALLIPDSQEQNHERIWTFIKKNLDSFQIHE